MHRCFTVLLLSVAGVLVATQAGAQPSPAHTAVQPGRTALRTCYLLFGPISDLGYTFAHNLGRVEAHRLLVEAYPGLDVSSEYAENAFFEPDGGAAIVERFIRNGCEVVYATAPGFTDMIRPFVAQYPNITFALQNAFVAPSFAPDRLVAYAAKPHSKWYLAGIAAAQHRRQAIGFIAAFLTVPEVAACALAFVAGVRSVHPNEIVNVIEIGNWYDPAADRVAAKALHEILGCDVVAHYGDSPAVSEYATETAASGRPSSSMFAIAMHGQANRYKGDNVLTCVYSTWDPVYYTINSRRAQGLSVSQDGMFAGNVAKLCELSTRADSATFRALASANESQQPFHGWSDAALRNVTMPSSAPGVRMHVPATAPSSCPHGTVVVFTRRVDGALQNSCRPCLANTFTTDGVQCYPCPTGLLSAGGAASCSPPPSDDSALRLGAVVGSVVAVLAIAVSAVAVAVAIRRRARPPSYKDAANLPTSRFCSVVVFGIHGAATLWESDARAMAEYLERYHAAVRDVVGRYGGYEVRTAGETCVVVALRPSTALMLAVDVARAIGALETPDVSSATSAASDASFRPSVGIAHGEAEAVTTTAPEREAERVVGKSRPTHAIDFIGPAVEMALALQDAAVPGEILAESVTARDGMLDVPAGMCSLGRRRTLDVAAENPLQPTVAAYRIEAPGLPRVVPAAGASETPPDTGTPAQFGRPLEDTDAALRVEPQGAHHSRARRRRNDVAADVVHILGLLPQKDRDRVRRELQRSIDELHTAGNVSERSRTAAQIIAALPSPPPSPPTSPIGRNGKPDDQPAAALSPHATE